MAIRFGTDGVRGRAFEELTLGDAYAIGHAAAQVLGGERALIGRDTRESGPALRDALAAGFQAAGVEPVDLGVAPTPAVAFAAGRHGSVGAMVSASHNPWFDNGIKLFSRNGSKLSDAEQVAIETHLQRAQPSSVASGVAGNIVLDSAQADVGLWLRSVIDSIAGLVDSLAGISLVLDMANGSGSHVVAPALVDLGAAVTPMFNLPDGRNINEACGSTYPQALAAEVVRRGADLGLALDGDADRLLAVDHSGRIVDGDHLMAMLALDMSERDALAHNQLVVTVMSNLGLLRSMEAAGIQVDVTPVGDRAVLQAMEQSGANLGGEQSGHFIFSDFATTGDGFLSGLQILSLVKRSGRSLAELAAEAMESFPQVLQSVRVTHRIPDIADVISAEIEAVEQELGENGRVLVRSSGTEPVVRVMVEATSSAVAEASCGRLCDAVRAASPDQ